MHRLAVVCAVVIAVASTGLRAAPVDDLDAIIGRCGEPQAEQACADALWNFADVTGDGRLTLAEVTRLFRIALDSMMSKQETAAKVNAAQNPAEAMAAENDRAMAAATAFVTAPIAAQIMIANYDYDGDGLVARTELYHDLTEVEFHKALSDEVRKFPQRAGGALMRALQAQQQLNMGNGGGGGN